MKRTYKFKEGQKVKTYDREDGVTIYGVVTDTTSQSVFIQWEDLSSPTEHFDEEYDQIKLSNHNG